MQRGLRRSSTQQYSISPLLYSAPTQKRPSSRKNWRRLRHSASSIAG
jgi:hypothetical protein